MSIHGFPTLSPASKYDLVGFFPLDGVPLADNFSDVWPEEEWPASHLALLRAWPCTILPFRGRDVCSTPPLDDDDDGDLFSGCERLYLPLPSECIPQSSHYCHARSYSWFATVVSSMPYDTGIVFDTRYLLLALLV